MATPPNEPLPACCGDNDNNFGLLLHFLRQGMIKYLEHALADQDLGLNFTQYRVLKMLSNVPHISASELARRLEHDAGALTRLLDKMQERDFAHQRRPRAAPPPAADPRPTDRVCPERSRRRREDDADGAAPARAHDPGSIIICRGN